MSAPPTGRDSTGGLRADSDGNGSAPAAARRRPGPESGPGGGGELLLRALSRRAVRHGNGRVRRLPTVRLPEPNLTKAGTSPLLESEAAEGIFGWGSKPSADPDPKFRGSRSR